MIKIFGQIRYHWQPELSWAIIYWSLTAMPFFIALSLLYEKTKNPGLVFFLVGLTVFLTVFGFHRYFIMEPELLKIVSFTGRKQRAVAIDKIHKIEVSKYRLCLHIDGHRSRTFYMRKWPKKYFLDALAIHPKFSGEVELVDNIHRVDYFKTYRKNKKPLVKD